MRGWQPLAAKLLHTAPAVAQPQQHSSSDSSSSSSSDSDSHSDSDSNSDSERSVAGAHGMSASAAARMGELEAFYAASGHEAYPGDFRPSMSVDEFRQTFGGIEAGSRHPDQVVRLAGRVLSKREGSKT